MVQPLGPVHLEAFRKAGFKPVVMVKLKPRQLVVERIAVSGDRRLFNYPAVVSKITPRNSKYDEDRRRTTVGKMTVTFIHNEHVDNKTLPIKKGGWLQAIISTTIIFNARIELFIGTQDLPESEFKMFWKGRVKDAHIDPTGTLHHLDCENTIGILNSEEFSGNIASEPPLDVMLQIIQAGSSSPDLFDASTFDQELHPTIAHHGVSRTGRSGQVSVVSNQITWLHQEIVDPILSISLMLELLTLVDGGLFTGPTGKTAFKKLDRTEASVRSLTQDDIIGIPRQLSTYANLLNRSTMRLSQAAGRLGDMSNRPDARIIANIGETIEFTSENLAAQADYAYEGESSIVVPETIDSPWLNHATWGASELSGTLPTLSVKTLGIASRVGFAGTVLPAPRVSGDTVPVARQLNAGAGRFAYLMVTGEDTNGEPVFEIFRAVAATLDWGTGLSADNYGDVWPITVTWTIDQRSLFGSTAFFTNFRGRLFYDVTIPKAFTEGRVDQFFAGVPEFAVRINLWHRDLEEGDIIDVNHPIFSSLAMIGADSLTKWRIVKRDEDPLGDSPGIDMVLRWIRTDTVPVTVITFPPAEALPTSIQTAINTADDEFNENKRLSAFTDFDSVTAIGSLAVTINSGSGRAENAQASTAPLRNLTLTALRDHYVRLDMWSGEIRQYEVPNNDPVPAVLPSEIPLWKFITDSVGLTAKTDQRVFSEHDFDVFGYYFDATGAIYLDASGEPYWRT